MAHKPGGSFEIFFSVFSVVTASLSSRSADRMDVKATTKKLRKHKNHSQIPGESSNSCRLEFESLKILAEIVGEVGTLECKLDCRDQEAEFVARIVSRAFELNGV